MKTKKDQLDNQLDRTLVQGNRKCKTFFQGAVRGCGLRKDKGKDHKTLERIENRAPLRLSLSETFGDL